VLGMPGLEVGMPGVLLAHESGLVVDPALMDVDIGSEDLACPIDQARMVRELLEDLIGAMDVEDRPDFVGLRFADSGLNGRGRGVLREPVELFGEEGQLLGRDELIDRQVARVFVVLELRRREGSVIGGTEDDGTRAWENLSALTGASRIEICSRGRR